MCLLFGLHPPGFEGIESFDELAPWSQAELLAFTTITGYEEDRKFEMLLNVICKSPTL